MSERTDARPRQVRVADEIRWRIEKGEYAPGAKLPTLEELANQNLCSFTVVRKAVDLLKQQGLVVSAQGKGSFVRDRPKPRRHGIERYARSRWASGTAILAAEAEKQGHSANQLIRELAEVPAPEVVAEHLNIQTGTSVWVRRRTTMIDGRPNQLADSYYELETVKGTRILEEDTGPGGGFARLEEAGHTLAEIGEEWSVRMPTGPESVTLQLPPGTPVVDLIRTTYDTTAKAVEVMLAVIAGDMVGMSYRFPIPD